jgi:hypothetical protein
VHALAGELLLQAWERGASVPEPQRPLALLGVALPDRSAPELADVPVTERDRLLLRLHQLSFGAQLSAIADCSGCSAQLELAVSVAELVALTDGGEGAGLTWTEAGRRFEMRPAATADLLASLAASELEDAQELLLSRCVTVDPPLHDERLSQAPAVLERFERLHAAAELRCGVTCPECARSEVVDLDIGRFLWTEVRRAAARLLREIHALAAGYGWSEHAILAMGAPRRAAYLELVAT